MKDLQRTAPFGAPFEATPACAYWPAANRMPKPNPQTFPKVLVLQAELDSATAYEDGRASADWLPGARLVSIDNEATHGVFPYLTTCADDPVHRYFLTGRLPAAKYTACQGLPLPDEDKTYDVAGSVGPRGDIKIRVVTDDVRRANRLVQRILREQSADPLTENADPTQ